MNKVELLRNYTNYLKSICFETYDGALLDYLEMTDKEAVSIEDDEKLAQIPGLSRRVTNALRRSGYQTLGDVKNDLRWKHGEIRHLGPKGIDEIKLVLRKRNVGDG